MMNCNPVNADVPVFRYVAKLAKEIGIERNDINKASILINVEYDGNSTTFAFSSMKGFRILAGILHSYPKHNMAFRAVVAIRKSLMDANRLKFHKEFRNKVWRGSNWSLVDGKDWKF